MERGNRDAVTTPVHSDCKPWLSVEGSVQCSLECSVQCCLECSAQCCLECSAGPGWGNGDPLAQATLKHQHHNCVYF